MSEGLDLLLDVRAVSKHFGGVYALNNASLSVARGEVHALIGPNGAGKTTLIHVLSGALPLNGGQVVFDGVDLVKRPMHERVTLGLARSYQITNIFTRLTVLDNVAMAVQSRARDWGTSFSFWKPFSLDSAIIDEAHALLAQVSLTGMATRLGGQLSHGEQRSLEVALADHIIVADGETFSLYASELIQREYRNGEPVIKVASSAGETRIADKIRKKDGRLKA